MRIDAAGYTRLAPGDNCLGWSSSATPTTTACFRSLIDPLTEEELRSVVSTVGIYHPEVLEEALLYLGRDRERGRRWRKRKLKHQAPVNAGPGAGVL